MPGLGLNGKLLQPLSFYLTPSTPRNSVGTVSRCKEWAFCHTRSVKSRTLLHAPAGTPLQLDFRPLVIEITDLLRWVNSHWSVAGMSVMAHAEPVIET